MKANRQLLYSTLIAVLPALGYAAESTSPSAEMDRLISEGQFEQALSLGEASLTEWEGDPEFDFVYGLAALEGGDPNEAVFALERAGATATNRVLRERARLELARAYFVTNNLTAAENLFNLVLENDPPANVQQNIEAFLQLIDTRRNEQSPSFRWNISSVIGSDDNINSATSNGLIDTPLIGLIELDQAGQQTEDQFSNTTVGMNYVYPITRDQSINVNLGLIHLDNFETNQFDIDSIRGEVAYAWGNASNRFRHGVAIGQVNLDGDGFQESASVNSSWQHVGSNGWYQSLSASLTQIRYDTTTSAANALRDVDQVLITAGLTKIAGQATHSVNLYHANEDPQNPRGGRHNGRKFTGLAYNLLYRLSAQHTPYVRASIQDVEHDSEHPVFFNTIRSDDNETVTAGWLWTVARNLVVTGEASYTDNKSDIELFDYSRFRYQLGFRYQF